VSGGAPQFPVIFDQPGGQQVLFHQDRLEWDSGGARKVFAFDEIASIRFHPITDMDTRNPFFEIRTADGRKGKIQELARIRELFGLFRGVLAPPMAQRLRDEVEGGREVVFDEVRGQARVWLVLGALLVAGGVGVALLMVAVMIADSDFDSGDLLAVSWLAVLIGLPGLVVLGKYVIMRNRGVAISQHGIKRALAAKHPWVPWDQIRSVTVLDQQVVLATPAGQSPVTLSYKATNYVVFTALLRLLLPDEVPWEWRLEALRPGGPGPKAPPPRWKVVEG